MRHHRQVTVYNNSMSQLININGKTELFWWQLALINQSLPSC